MEIKNKIEDVQRYFIDKLLKKDFIILEREYHIVKVNISGYIFYLWISNGYEHICTYSMSFDDVSFIELYFTDEEKKIIYNNLIGCNNKGNSYLDVLISEKSRIEEKINYLTTNKKNNEKSDNCCK